MRLVEIFGQLGALVEFVHLYRIPGADFFIKPIVGLRANQFKLKFLGQLVLFNRPPRAVVISPGILAEDLAGFLVAMDLGQIVAETHLTADALVVVYPNSIGLQSAGWGFLVEQVNTVLYRAVQFT